MSKKNIRRSRGYSGEDLGLPFPNRKVLQYIFELPFIKQRTSVQAHDLWTSVELKHVLKWIPLPLEALALDSSFMQLSCLSALLPKQIPAEQSQDLLLSN